MKTLNQKLTAIILLAVMMSSAFLVFEIPGVKADQSLIALHNFDENSGSTLHDYSGNLNTGTIYGASWVSGKYNYGLSFDGTNDYVEVPDASILRTASDWTRTIWVYSNYASSGDGNLHDIWTQRTTSNKFLLRLNTDGNFKIYATTNGGFSNIATFASAYHTWTMITATKCGSNITVYKDGSYVTSINNAISENSDNSKIIFASYYDHNGQWFSGVLDDAQLYNRALSSQEVSNLYNTGKTTGTAETGDSIQNAINLGLDWLDNMAYREINSTHAVATDSPCLSFRLHRSDGYWTIFGKETDTNLPTSATMIRGGATDPQGTTDDLNLITGEVNNQRMYYFWDIDGDGEYDDMKLYVEYATMDNDDTRLAVKVVSYTNVGVTYDLEIETTQLIATVALNSQASIDKQWGWQGARYTIRPTTKGLADLYVWLATTQFSWLNGQTYQQVRGINYADRALKLYRTWYGSGYIIDRFDGHYGATLNIRPWAGQYGIPNYPANPDFIVQPRYLHGNNDLDAYIDNSNKTAGWYNYNNLPDGSTIINQGNIASYSTVSREVMPDDTEWDKTPFICDTNTFAFNYKSRTGFNYARNQYLANGFEFDQLNYNDLPYAIPGVDVLLGFGTDAKSIRACGDMYKYGTNVPYGLSTLKSEFIDSAEWDGNGIAFDSWHGIKIGWEYPAYGTHNTATYGNALVQYYKVTSDSSVGTRADQVAGVLLMLQNKYGTPTYSRSRQTFYYRPEFVGSFMPGYAVAYSFGQQDIYTSSWIDATYGTLADLGIFEEDPYPLAYPVMGNVECTIPSVWTLIQYKTTGRTPSNPQAPNYNLPLSDVTTAYTDHGGSNSGDGLSYFVGQNLQSTHITGNKYQVTGTLSKMRLGAYGGDYTSGSGWSSIEYVWNFNLDNPTTNWRAKAYFTTPNYMAWESYLGTNSFQLQVYLYQGSTQIATDTEVLQQEWTANSASVGTSGRMYVFDDLCHVNNLASGSYTVKLKFTVQANGEGYLWIGDQCSTANFDGRWRYSTAGEPPRGLPMGLEHFGYDMEEAQNAIYYNTLTVQSATGGSTNMSVGIHGFIYNQHVTLTAIPDSGYEFYYWKVDGEAAGGQLDKTVIMDEPHTIQPQFRHIQYFLACGYPPNGFYTLPYSDWHNPGTTVWVTAYSPSASYRFDHWHLDGSDYTAHLHDNPCPVYMDSGHVLGAYFVNNAQLNVKAYYEASGQEISVPFYIWNEYYGMTPYTRDLDLYTYNFQTDATSGYQADFSTFNGNYAGSGYGTYNLYQPQGANYLNFYFRHDGYGWVHATAYDGSSDQYLDNVGFYINLDYAGDMSGDYGYQLDMPADWWTFTCDTPEGYELNYIIVDNTYYYYQTYLELEVLSGSHNDITFVFS